MTSSLRATGQASVRGTPAASDAVAGAWALVELTPQTSQRVSPLAGAAVETATPAALALVAAERARLIDEGYARGLADGERRATTALLQRVTDSMRVMNEIVEQLRDVASNTPAVLEENISAIAVVVARQVIGRAVAADREIVADLVRRALAEFPIEQSIRIRVNPEDLAQLTSIVEGPDNKPITGAREVTWLGDLRVSRGGCLLEGRDRIIDGRVDTALERAYRRMTQTDAT